MSGKHRVYNPLLTLIIFGVGSVICNIVYIKTGANHTLNPAVKGIPENILWRYQGDKVVEFDATGYDWYRFEDRASLNPVTGEFTLKPWYKNDSGVYDSQIQVNKRLQRSKHTVEVIDPVSIPKVACVLKSREALELQCLLEAPVEATFAWSGPKELISTNQSITVSRENDIYSLYICTVRNKVSQNSAQIKLNDCHKGPDFDLWVIILVITIVVLILTALLTVILVRNRKQSRDAVLASNNQNYRMEELEEVVAEEPNVEDNPLEEENEEQQEEEQQNELKISRCISEQNSQRFNTNEIMFEDRISSLSSMTVGDDGQSEAGPQTSDACTIL